MDARIAARSYLFVPGHKPALFEKAVSAGADVVVLDLEDAVAPDTKPSARGAIADWLRTGRHAMVRINATTSSWLDDDLAMCRDVSAAALMIPKAEDPRDVARIVEALPAAVLVAQIETARGLHMAEAIARVPGVQRLAFGALDYQLDLDLDLEHNPAALLHARSQLVFASKLAGVLPPVDGVTPTWDQAAPVEAEARAARGLGFGGKLCIHPKQVAWVNACFAPSARELAWAERVVAADVAAGGHATEVNGEMIDRPVVERAKAVLSRAVRAD